MEQNRIRMQVPVQQLVDGIDQVLAGAAGHIHSAFVACCEWDKRDKEKNKNKGADTAAHLAEGIRAAREYAEKLGETKQSFQSAEDLARQLVEAAAGYLETLEAQDAVTDDHRGRFAALSQKHNQLGEHLKHAESELAVAEENVACLSRRMFALFPEHGLAGGEVRPARMN